jgi:hypothetical protein
MADLIPASAKAEQKLSPRKRINLMMIIFPVVKLELYLSIPAS